jgi:hypothetical protein
MLVWVKTLGQGLAEMVAEQGYSRAGSQGKFVSLKESESRAVPGVRERARGED